MGPIDRAFRGDPATGRSRRQFLRGAVATGGAAALAACLGDDESLDAPPGVADPTSLPASQHAWNDALASDEHGTVEPPTHHVFVGLSLREPPDDEAAEAVEVALRGVERAIEWGPTGVLFTLGYTPAYFDRFDGDLPGSVDLPDPEPITAITAPSRVDVDEGDALLHLASDDAATVLAVEEALVGDRATLNGRRMDADLTAAFESTTRHTGFVGPGLPADRQVGLEGIPDGEPVPDDAPFFMGFRSGFAESQATEARVTIPEGPFAGGTTQHVESLALDLDVWFEDSDQALRIARMFSPAHDEERVGTVGERLDGSTGVAETVDAIDRHAREDGVVGHAQKVARAREDGEPVLLRRDVNTTDGDVAGVHFVSLQREMGQFVRAREAMLGTEFHDRGLGPREANGILQYVRVRTWGSYLLPPRSRRALPHPDPAG